MTEPKRTYTLDPDHKEYATHKQDVLTYLRWDREAGHLTNRDGWVVHPNARSRYTFTTSGRGYSLTAASIMTVFLEAPRAKVTFMDGNPRNLRPDNIQFRESTTYRGVSHNTRRQKNPWMAYVTVPRCFDRSRPRTVFIAWCASAEEAVIARFGFIRDLHTEGVGRAPTDDEVATAREAARRYELFHGRLPSLDGDTLEALKARVQKEKHTRLTDYGLRLEERELPLEEQEGIVLDRRARMVGV